LTTLSVIPLTGEAMGLKEFNKMTEMFGNTEQMPVLFLGHGSPMNAIEDNEFSRKWEEIGKTLPKPEAVLCISAHWETRGTFVTAMLKPATIHDFGGFPQTLFDVQYPAPGSPILAAGTKNIITKTEVGLDEKWGLDHGCWSVVRHLYPKADIPVIQMSLDYYQTPQYHYDIAKELATLRKKGVLIIGSGNMVHNLGMLAWAKLNSEEYGYDWAIEANEKMKKNILSDDHNQLINYKSQSKAYNMAIPTPEHYLPLLYALALKEKNEKLILFNDKIVAGSLSMTSLRIDSN
jgi:4,5-DOPA dioxygenase extradiol